jgi:uncharacterized protein (DUF58 family)
MNSKEKDILNKVKRVEFSIRKILGGVSIGVRNSTFRGQGMTFSDIRAYTPGDDIRNFAWQVMARTGQPFVKEFEEERDLEVHVALDSGASMQFGGKKKSKAMIQAYVLAFLGLSTAKSKDKFGGLVFSSGQIKRIPAKRGDDHVRRALFSYIEESSKQSLKKTNLNVALDYFAKIRAKNCVCILISDFSTPLDRKLLARVKAKHDVKLVHVYDPFEKNFPDVGYIEGLSQSKSLTSFLFKGSASNNAKLLQEFQKREAVLEKTAKSFGISYIKQSTHDDELREMTKNLKLRSVYG